MIKADTLRKKLKDKLLIFCILRLTHEVQYQMQGEKKT